MEKKLERVSAPQSANEKELKEEYCELQSIIAETLYEAYEKVLDAVHLARKAKEIEPEDIDESMEEIDETMEEIVETKRDIEILLNEL